MKRILSICLTGFVVFGLLVCAPISILGHDGPVISDQDVEFLEAIENDNEPIHVWVALVDKPDSYYEKEIIEEIGYGEADLQNFDPSNPIFGGRTQQEAGKLYRVTKHRIYTLSKKYDEWNHYVLEKLDIIWFLTDYRGDSTFNGFFLPKKKILEIAESPYIRKIIVNWNYYLPPEPNWPPPPESFEDVSGDSSEEESDDISVESSLDESSMSDVIETLYGDVNGDDAIDLKDVLALRKCVAGFDAPFVFENADVTVDKQVDLKDCLILRRYLAGMQDRLGVKLVEDK